VAIEKGWVLLSGYEPKRALLFCQGAQELALGINFKKERGEKARRTTFEKRKSARRLKLRTHREIPCERLKTNEKEVNSHRR